MHLSWFSHIAVRYAAMMVAVTLLPLAIVLFAYDRYASSLLDTLSGSEAEQRLAVMQGRITSFLEARFAQLDTLANHPDLPLAFGKATRAPAPSGVRAVLEYEADNPDLYGILVFDAQDTVIGAIPSQAAAGAPYWGGKWEPLRDGVPRSVVARNEVVGPFLPREGMPGAIVIMRKLPASESPDGATIAIALHVRLSSLTELMGRDNLGGLVQPLLLTPQGIPLTSVGSPSAAKARLARPLDVLPGWRIALADNASRLEQPLANIREVLVIAAFSVIVSVAALVALLGGRLNRRIARLVDGSAALAEGQLGTRITDEGNDELTVLAGAFNRMAARQRDTLSAAVEAEKMAVLGRFATSFAHETRNPLAAVKTTVQAFLATEERPERRNLLQGMDEEIDRLDESLRDFLIYAKPAPASPRRVVMDDVLRRCGTLVAHQLQSDRIALTTLGETGLAIHVDPFHLQQIFMNLIANAIDAMPDGGRITIRVRRAGSQGIIEVSDTGEGIPPEMRDKIMEPFVTTRSDGSGLGLPISRQLAELNKGALSLASQPGHGTTVTLTLPRDEGAAA